MLRSLLLLAGLSLPVLSPAQTGLERCAVIEAADQRLACFDALARPPAQATATPAAATLDTAPAAPAQQALTLQPVEIPALPTTTAIEQFGAETLPAEPAKGASPDRIESQLKGHFDGWRKDTVFELTNGQVWRCRDCREVHHQAESPRVSIRRSFTGVYWLKVEGLNQQAKVRRIK